MKRFLLIFIVAMLPVIGSTQPVANETTPDPATSKSEIKLAVKFEIAPLEFSVTSENTVSLIGYDFKKDPNRGVVDIPSHVIYESKSYRVTTIERAFKNSKYITSVTIPTTITDISSNSFSFCISLTSITIPSSVRSIGSSAFIGCRNLNMIEIQPLEISIGGGAFSYCKNLTLVKIHADKMSVTPQAFAQSPNIREVQVKSNNRSYFMGLKSNPHIVILDEPQQISIPANTHISIATQQPIAETPKIISDVDQDIPQTSLKNSKTFAVIIANEKYTTESNVDFALNDGKIFKEYCEKTLGIPTENIRFVENGTLGSIGAGIEWLQKVLEVYKQDANAIVYYSGHGIPNEATGDAYLLPTDCQGSNFKYAYSINRLYKELGEAGAKSVTYFIDACFSGTQRKGEMMVAARGVAIKAKSGVLSGNSVAFAAASGDETAFAYNEKGHGMFTYFLLKKLQETKGEVSYGELADYIQQNVKQKSIVVSPRLQSPNAISSTSASEGWQSWKLIK